MMQSVRAALIVCLFAFLVAGTNTAYAACPPNSHEERQTGNVVHCKCNGGFENRAGACRRISGDPACIKRAGEQLQRGQQKDCAHLVGACFTDNKAQLTGAALGCIIACRQLAGCAIGCGVSGLVAENIVTKCIDVRNSCFEEKLADHKRAVEACKRG